MKNLKKLLAVLMAVMMVAALSTVAFATPESMTGEGGIIGEFQTADTPNTPAKDRSVVIYKEITAYNPETCTVNAPAITFSYEIVHSAALAGKNVNDDESHHSPAASAHVLTKEGIGTPTITGTAAGQLALSPTVAADQLNASVNGTANRFPLTISFDGIDFTSAPGTGAGVYRYQINETTTVTTKNASGIKEGTVANTLFIDVYVDGSGNVYGYVLFTTNTDIDASGATTDAEAAAAVTKTEGFVGSQPDDGTYANEDASIADKYYTFNLEITKTVANDTYTQTNHHEFPFHVTLDNPTVTANVLPIMTVGTYATQSTLTAGKIGSASNTPADATTWTPTIGHTGKITYVGIPCGTTVTIYEENDVTGTTYAASVANADATVTTKNIYYDGTTLEASNTATVSCGATALNAATENHTSTAATPKQVAFTNTLLQISPTGIALRVAPFVLILAAGMMLLVLSRKSRKAED